MTNQATQANKHGDNHLSFYNAPDKKKKKKTKICKEIMLGSNRTKEARTLFKLNVPQYKYHGLVLIYQRLPCTTDTYALRADLEVVLRPALIKHYSSH